MLSVKFATKVVAEGDPDYRLVTDKEEKFMNFSRAMEFIRRLRGGLSTREILLGNPQIEEVA